MQDLCLMTGYLSPYYVDWVLFYLRLFLMPFKFLDSLEVEHVIFWLFFCFNLSLALVWIYFFNVCLLFVNLFAEVFSILPIEFLSSFMNYCVFFFLFLGCGFKVCESFYAVLDFNVVVLCLIERLNF